jgi:lipopolysaccharide biosynthesis glycosyltransferase
VTLFPSADRPARNAVCLCTDRNTLIPALFVADAVGSHAMRPGNGFDILVVAEPSEVTDVEREWMARRGIGLCDDLDMAPLRGVAKLQPRLSVATLVKLVLAGHFAARYDKILYLDVDLTIHDDVSALFALDTGEHAVAAVPGGRRWPCWMEAERAQFVEHVRKLGMTEPYRFINSGVLLIDVAKWNRDEVGARALDFIRRNAELCFLPDEHGLNAVLDGRQAELSPVWNMAPGVLTKPAIRESAEPIVVHYIGPDKPWKRYGYGKRIARNLAAHRLYRDFLRDSPWQGWLDAQWTAQDFRKNILYELRLISRRIRGRSSALPSRRELRIDAEDFRNYCMETRFVDVDQGIVTRQGGQLRLDRQRVVAA